MNKEQLSKAVKLNEQLVIAKERVEIYKNVFDYGHELPMVELHSRKTCYLAKFEVEDPALRMALLDSMLNQLLAKVADIESQIENL